MATEKQSIFSETCDRYKKTKKLSKQAALPFLEPQENTTHTGRLVHLLSDAAVGTRPGPGERGYSDEIDLRRLSLRSSELTHFMYHVVPVLSS